METTISQTPPGSESVAGESADDQRNFAATSPASGEQSGGRGNDFEAYQSVSRAAVIACVFGALGLTAFITPWLLPLPLIAIVAAWTAFAGFRRYPDELVGAPAAIAGIVVAGITMLGAPSWHIYEYATEVPEGYTRVSFESLMTATGQPELPTPDALQMDGEQVFIKGYIHPNSMDTMLSKRFVIVPDLGTCCFGGQPPLTHMIEVTLVGEQYASKSMRKQRLAGTLHVNRSLKPIDGLTGVFYQLRADILK